MRIVQKLKKRNKEGWDKNDNFAKAIVHSILDCIRKIQDYKSVPSRGAFSYKI